MLIASLIFYVYYTGILCIFMLVTSLSIYFAALWLDKIDICAGLSNEHLSVEEKVKYKNSSTWQKKAVVFILLLICLGTLVLLKYYNFVSGQLNQLLKMLPLHLKLATLSIAIPLGISFYSLQAVSYVVDVYRGKVKANYNYAQVLLFLCFFPQIVEGPIGRYDNLAPQLYEGRRFNYLSFTHGMQLILWGLIKKIVIANRASMLVNEVFNNHTKYSGASIILAILLYTLELYADFSGSIDVVTGSAQMFGINLAQNFRRPFFASSVDEFWRRWHMTLGAWMRDYVFYPVSLSRPVTKLSGFLRNKKHPFLRKLSTVGIALFSVWLLMGIWHGAGWKYLAYGMYYFALIMLGMIFEPLICKAAGVVHLNRKSKPYRVLQVIRTFLLVNVGMLIFRASNLSEAFNMFISIFKWHGISNALLHLGVDAADLGVLGIGALLLFVTGLLQEKGIMLRQSIGKWPLPPRWALYMTGIFVLIIFGAYGSGYIPADLIYAKF